MDFLDKVKEFFNYYKINLIEGGILLVIIVISNFLIYEFVNDKISNIKVEAKEVTIEKEEVITKDKEKEYYKFDIKGDVINPGVYTLEKGSRVIDAINIAGGLTENADTSVNNLSKSITDEMVIIIYTKEEVANFKKILEQEEIENNNCVEYNEVITNDSCIKNEEQSSEVVSELDKKISINSATLELLMTLPGIGEAKAKSIITYRKENGEFKNIEDIMNVSGIGESVFEKIKEYITI